MNNMIVGWYLMYTKPRHEKKVHSHLKELDINSFLPTRKILRSWHDRKKFIDEPLFPSYVFIYLNDLESYYKGMDTDGVLYYVRTGKTMARVHESVVNNIKLLVAQPGDLEVTHDAIQPGTQLVICQGALTGLSCEIVQVNGKQKALVRVALLQRSLLLSLPADYLIANPRSA
jgi:transcriptional antiterminator RfaH